ncbi:uncharacterized protein LOC18433283 isoform X2 [Amborella trichopoda]|uniref:Uncharacterized protein n=1 Tax=Amborella trichopoda TaxID=13333 RepID=W1PDH4_AMBTC|nr:uncharacterized protein LOC18433283 isoform X2 [Amborella trichopoda]ERN05115.1 hypothetical protein AMTR_s00053p00164430 [Amborella trichopoda]|eukprot:XP_006843440.1 uncharacterized protein LOC18433283 isoform X2 [Amborella trichopoda]
MDRSDPELAPEWLRGTTQHSLSSSQRGDSVLAPTSRNKSSLLSDYNFTNHLSRTSLPSFRRNSSINGSSTYDRDSKTSLRTHSSNGRNSRAYDFDRNQDWLRDRSPFSRERRDLEHEDNLTRSTVKPVNWVETNTLKRQLSTLDGGKRGDDTHKNPGSKLGALNGGPLIGGGLVSNIRKSAFEREFPSLKSEDKQQAQIAIGAVDMIRVASPLIRVASPGLSATAFMGSDGWTSALAEVPVSNGVKSNSSSSTQQITSVTSPSSVVQSPGTGLNMAETVAQAPARVRTPPQLSVEAQRLEVLAIKQSRQLIPMTPSMSKTSGVSLSEKTKLKPGRSSERATPAVKPSTPAAIPQLPGSYKGATKPDTFRPSQGGKLLLLKPSRERADGTGMLRNGNHSPPGFGNTVSVVSSTRPKDVTLMTEDKRASSQAQNRSDFFNSLRRKTQQSSAGLSSGFDKLSNNETEVIPSQTGFLENSLYTCSESGKRGEEGEAKGEEEGRRGGTVICGSEEEEAAFLRSLGWEENAGGEELTEEEISAFYKELQQMGSQRGTVQQLRLESSTGIAAHHVGSLERVSSSCWSSSDSESV